MTYTLTPVDGQHQLGVTSNSKGDRSLLIPLGNPRSPQSQLYDFTIDRPNRAVKTLLGK
ncbi:MAG: hypothetical protein ACRCZS_01215 [Chroococcidiopsis sp.]